ncbi:hypothetical protein [Nocardioides bruguierae]|uniref:hypothetical protein n=1 Tax=Nocardioides bruguierae TaxID=2945102 RepID=UPI0020206D09|nr:hypothetical protein [Nocardioides bruguierae]
MECGGGGLLYEVLAVRPDGLDPLGTSCLTLEEATAQDPQAAVITTAMVSRALQRVDLPRNELMIQPPDGETLVNIDTLVHTEAEPFTETVTLLGRTIDLDITPAQFTWTFGDGASLTTTDPGRAYDPGLPMTAYVSHQYETAQQADLAVTTTWTARWRVDGGTWQDVDGTVESTSPAQRIQVRTATPRLTATGATYTQD